jgi:polyhydroxyalkanoate synthase
MSDGFATLSVSSDGPVLYVDIDTPPMNLIGPELVRDLVSLMRRSESDKEAITKYADLFANLYDEEYVRGFDAIDTWLREMIPYPKEAFRQLVKEVVVGNKMLKNELVFGTRSADLKRVVCPVLAFSGKDDNIAPPAATKGILELTGSGDTTFLVVPGGHIGVVAGSAAKTAVWEPMAKWLEEKVG